MADTPYVTATEIRRTVAALTNEVTYPDEALASYVREFEEIAEEYTGTAWTPRQASDTFDVGDHWRTLYGTELRPLSHLNIRAITLVNVDGVEVDPTSYTLKPNALIARPDGFGNHAVVTYEHGLDQPPQVLRRACMLYVRMVALGDQSGLSREVIVQSSEGVTFRYSTPDWRAGRPTGFLDPDRLLNTLPNYRIPRISG
jgi:hypothetical protein